MPDTENPADRGRGRGKGRREPESDVPPAPSAPPEVEPEPLTPEAQAALAAQVSRQVAEESVRGKTRAALTANKAYLALGNTTAVQNAAQVKSLTRQVDAIIRLVLNEFDDDQ